MPALENMMKTPPGKPVDDLAELKTIVAAEDKSEAMLGFVDMARYSISVNRFYTKLIADEISKVRTAIDTDDPAFREYDLEKTMRIFVEGSKIIARYREFIEKRLEHGLKNLKQKGLWADNMNRLSDIAKNKNMPDAYKMINVVWEHMGNGMPQIGKKIDIDDNSWKLGLELAFMQHAPDILCSDQLFGLRIRELYPYIAINTIMAAHAAKLAQVLESDEGVNEIREFIFHRHANDPEVIARLTEKMDKIYAEEIKRTDARSAKLEEQLKSLEEENSSLKERLTEAQQAADPGKRRIERINEEKTALAEALAEAQSQANLYKNALAERDMRISQLSEKIQSQDENPIPLPESGVVFVGGHPNLVNKLRSTHPRWKFIDGSDKGFAEFTQPPTLIIFYNRHLSHPVAWKARSLITPQTKTIYVKSTNLDLIDNEISRIWNAVAGTPEQNTEKE